MPPNGSDPGWLTWLAAAQIITWIIVVCGWIFTHSSNNTRERRKELRAELEGIRKNLDELVELAQVFYTSAPDDDSEKRTHEIVIKQNRLLMRMERLPHFDSSLKVSGLTDLMDALTGGEFESNTRVALNHSDARLFKIAAKAEIVFNHLEMEFKRIFFDGS